MLTSILHSDAFQRRERANEDYAIRQREKERLLELKAKISEQQQHLQRLSEHMYVPRELQGPGRRADRVPFLENERHRLTQLLPQ